MIRNRHLTSIHQLLAERPICTRRYIFAHINAFEQRISRVFVFSLNLNQAQVTHPSFLDHLPMLVIYSKTDLGLVAMFDSGWILVQTQNITCN